MLRFMLTLSTLACCVPAFAAGAPPEFRWTKPVLVDQLVRDVSVYLEKNPDDADAHSLLGRIHHLAYENKRTVLRVYVGNHKLPHLVEKGDVFIEGPRPESVAAQEKPRDVEISDAQRKEHLVEAARNFAEAIERDGKNGRYHLLLADTLLEFSSKAEELSPLARHVLARQDLSELQQREIKSHINGLITDYVGVKDMTWLLDHGNDAEPMIAEKLQNAHGWAKPRLERVLAAHWKNLAIEHYAQAHNLTWKQDVASYDPAKGEAWDQFTALRAGRTYLQLTFERKDEKTLRQSQQVNNTFASLNKKIGEYRGPVQ